MRKFALLFISLALNSCFAIHPELQTARSLEKGEIEFGSAVYGGQITLNQSIGLATMINYGIRFFQKYQQQTNC